MNTVPGESVITGLAAASDVDGASRLLRLAALAEELGTISVAEEARELSARVSEGRFYVACIGQFKRGKSTLINALIGAPVLPVGFIPVTAVPTVIRFGQQMRARVRARDASWREIGLLELGEYVSEEHNPENSRGIVGVEVFVPSPLLTSGMCLVDTPGLGSVFTGNTAATEAFIPHVDAALVVIGADPPLAGEELALVESVSRHVEDLILAINKADRTTDEERAAAVGFTRKLLEKRLQRPAGPVFEVSATERLEKRGPERDWRRLVEALGQLVEGSGRDLIRAAFERGLERLGEQLQLIVSEEREALERPIEESERRIAAMKESLTGAERSMRELGYLFTAEQHHLSDTLAHRHRAFLASVSPQANSELEEALQTVSRGMGPSYRRRVMREAQEVARRHVLPWLQTEQIEAEKEYRELARRFVQVGNDFLKKLADAGVREIARMPHALDPEAGFRIRSRFTFHDLIELAQPASPLRWVADSILGLVGAHGVIENDARQFLLHLLETNCTRVQSDILNRVQESRNRLEVEIRKLLHEIRRIADRALTHARTAQAEGAPAVQARRARLERLESEIRMTQAV
ncbi:MAG TPA: dynamin family protein [Terriglobia bacterium]|nr:dynamin family protein [Terriglobia bacterium]